MRIRNEEDPNGRERENQEGIDGGDAVIRTYYMKKKFVFSKRKKIKGRILGLANPSFKNEDKKISSDRKAETLWLADLSCKKYFRGLGTRLGQKSICCPRRKT